MCTCSLVSRTKTSHWYGSETSAHTKYQVKPKTEMISFYALSIITWSNLPSGWTLTTLIWNLRDLHMHFLQSYCTMLPSQALVYQHLGRPTTWPVLLRLMYHQLFSGCTPVMAMKWPMWVASPWRLREPLVQPSPSPSHSTLCTHLMEGCTPAGQQLTHLHQQWMPQEMWLSKVKYTHIHVMHNICNT